MTGLALKVAFPLTVDVGFGDHYNVAHFELQSGFIVCIGYTRLLHASIGREFSLRRQLNNEYSEYIKKQFRSAYVQI